MTGLVLWGGRTIIVPGGPEKDRKSSGGKKDRSFILGIIPNLVLILAFTRPGTFPFTAILNPLRRLQQVIISARTLFGPLQRHCGF